MTATPHRATPEQWAQISLAAQPREISPGISVGDSMTTLSVCVDELRDRLAAHDAALLELASTVAKAGNEHEKRLAAAEQRISELEGLQSWAPPEVADSLDSLTSRLQTAEQQISELEGKQDTQRVGMLDVYQHLDRLKTQHESNWSRIVKLEDALVHLPDAPEMVPAESLVEQVRRAIGDDAPCSYSNARAAIRAVANAARSRDLNGQSVLVMTWEGVARWLEQEVERHG